MVVGHIEQRVRVELIVDPRAVGGLRPTMRLDVIVRRQIAAGDQAVLGCRLLVPMLVVRRDTNAAEQTQPIVDVEGTIHESRDARRFVLTDPGNVGKAEEGEVVGVVIIDELVEKAGARYPREALVARGRQSHFLRNLGRGSIVGVGLGQIEGLVIRILNDIRFGKEVARYTRERNASKILLGVERHALVVHQG